MTHIYLAIVAGATIIFAGCMPDETPAACPISYATCGNAGVCATSIWTVDNCGACGVKCGAGQLCGTGCGETIGCYDVGGGTGPNDCPSCYPSDAGVCPTAQPVSLRCDPGAAIPTGCVTPADGSLGACCPPTPDGGA